MNFKRDKIIGRENHSTVGNIFYNMASSASGINKNNSLNSVINFFHEKGFVPTDLSIEEQLVKLDENFNIKTYETELSENFNKEVSMPLLLKNKNGDYEVLIPRINGEGKIMPKNITLKDSMKDMYEKKALCFYRVFKDGKVTHKNLLSFILKSISKSEYIYIFTFSLLVVIAGMILPWVTNFIYEKVVPTSNLKEVFPAGALLLSAILTATVLRFLQSVILTNGTIRVSAFIKSGIYDRLLKLKPEFFKKVKSGAVTNVVMEMSELTEVLSVRSVTTFISAFLSLIYFIQIKIYAPSVLWIAVVTGVVILLFSVIEGILSVRWQNNYVKSMSDLSGFCHEMFSGMLQIKTSGSEAVFFKRWSEHYMDITNKEDPPFLVKYANTIKGLILTLATGFIFIAGINLSFADYIAFSVAYGAFMVSFSKGSEIIKIISYFRGLCKIAKPVLEGECESYKSDKIRPDAFKGEIKISNLSFSYDKNEREVIKDMNLKIKEGESIGIAGTSGCGKSTLLRLILGFETPDKGNIYIDDYNLKELDLKTYRKNLGIVLQNTSLLTGDIFTNVSVMKPDATEKEVLSALDIALLKDDILSLPLKLKTHVDDESLNLSGGQKQRILIARAVLQKSPIMIFDEATSSLDNITQKEVMENLNKIKATKIFVAHRLSTLKECDRIVVLDKGSIREQGTYKELLDKKGIFYSLVKNQMEDKDLM